LDKVLYLPDKKVEKNLRLAIYDGVFAGAMTGFVQEYLAPFIILAGATVRQVGFLTAFPNLMAALLQIRSAEITDWLGSRKKVLNYSVLLQASMLVLMALLTVFWTQHIYIFIVLVALYTSFGAFATPAWGSLMSDLVPEDRRGEYFGWRDMLNNFVIILAMLSAGCIIHYSKNLSVTAGFAMIFILAYIFRMVSWSLLRRLYEPPLQEHTGRDVTFVSFLSSIRKSNFAKFVISVSLMNFSVNLAGPFFAVLMLRELHFSFILYTVIILTASLTIFITIKRWGMHADRVGYIKIIKSTSLLICFLPLLWVINRNPLFLIIVQVCAGFLWAGFNISAANFIFDAVQSRERTRSIAYFNVINGSFLFAGAFIGGFLVRELPPVFGSKILTLFLISSVLRLTVTCVMILRLQEVRQVKNVKSMDLFTSVIGIRPLLGIERKTLRY
jgi:MFS family permease